MFKTIALTGLAAALAVLPAAAPAQQGTSESYGSVGRGPHIPTQSLTPFDRAWNHNNQSKYDAENSADGFAGTGRARFRSSDGPRPRSR